MPFSMSPSAATSTFCLAMIVRARDLTSRAGGFASTTALTAKRPCSCARAFSRGGAPAGLRSTRPRSRGTARRRRRRPCSAPVGTASRPTESTETCRVIATGCTEVDLPVDDDEIVVPLASIMGATECPPGTCTDGRCDSAAVTVVATGRAHTCAYAYGGSLYCWGYNSDGQVGDGTSGLERDEPVLVSNDLAVSDSALGGIDGNWRSQSCALASGEVWCWGYNTEGQVGDGTMSNRARPTRVEGLSDVSNITAGGRHTCAVLDSGSVVCWGDDDHGQLGDGPGGMLSTTPVSVAGLGSVVEASAGQDHTCAREVSGSVYCWGAGDAGQLGTGDRAQADSPREVSLGARAGDVDAGSEHTCVVTLEGSVLCWGTNERGQLAQPSDVVDSTVPVPVDGIVDAVRVALGSGTSCALLANGTIRCWGWNQFGQRGDGTTAAPTAATSVLGIPDALELDYGSDHGCVIRATGQLYCWGRNQWGRLGVGDTDDSDEPRVRPRPATVTLAPSAR